MSDRYNDLLQGVEETMGQMREGIMRRKEFESHVADVDLWLKKAESQLAETISLDADVTVTATATLTNKYEVCSNFIGDL